MATFATIGISLGFCVVLAVFLRYLIQQMDHNG